MLALLAPAPLLAAREAPPPEPEAPAPDGVARAERIDEAHNGSSSDGPTYGPETDETRDTGRETESHCVLDLFGACFLNLTEEWRNASIDKENSSSWSWNASRSEKTGHRVELLDGAATAEVATGSASSEDRSGATANEHNRTYTYYGHSLGYSREHEQERRLDARRERGSDESARTFEAGADAAAPADVDVGLVRERDGTRGDHASESFEASNHTRDSYFGVPVDETADSSSRHSQGRTRDHWNRTAIEAGVALDAADTRTQLLTLAADRGDERHDSSSSWETSSSDYQAVVGLPFKDDAARDAGTRSSSGWREWTSLLVEVGGGLLRAGASYERGASSEASTHETSDRSGILGIGIENSATERAGAQHAWRRADLAADAGEGEAVAAVSYFDTEDSSRHESHEEHALGGSPLVGFGNTTDTYDRSKGAEASLRTGRGLVNLTLRHENTTDDDTNTTTADFVGDEFFRYASIEESTIRRTSVDADSDAAGSSASVYHENGTTREGDVAALSGTPGGRTYAEEGTRYGTRASLLEGALAPEVAYEDERSLTRFFVDQSEVTVDNQHQELRAGVAGEPASPDGTTLARYEAGHRETSDNRSFASDGGQVFRWTSNGTRTGGSATLAGGVVGAHGERTAEGNATYTGTDEEFADISILTLRGGASVDARKAPGALAPLDAALAQVDAAGPAREALATAVALALVPAGDAVGVVAVDAKGTITYLEAGDSAAFLFGHATVCHEQGLVTAPTIPGDGPVVPLANGAVATAFGAGALLCVLGAPAFVPLVLLSPALYYPLARGIVFATLRSDETAPPADAGLSGVVEAVAEALAPLAQDPAPVLAAYEQAAAVARDAAADAEGAYDRRTALLGATYGDAVDEAERRFGDVETRLRDRAGVDPADTWMTVAPQLRNPQAALWTLHAATGATDRALASAWPLLDATVLTLYTIFDANGWPDRGVDNPDEIPDIAVPTEE